MMPIIYRVGDALIMNSKSETWGLSMNEALASRIPLVATEKCGGAIDLINSSNGIIIKKSDNIEHMAQWVKDFKKAGDKFYNTIKDHSYQSILQKVINNIQ